MDSLYGYYIKNPPRQFKDLWIGMLNCPDVNVRGIFIAVNPSDMKSGMKILREGFQSFDVWEPDWWFIKRLISSKNIAMLKEKPVEEIDKILEILLANTYPFSWVAGGDRPPFFYDSIYLTFRSLFHKFETISL